MTDRVSSSIEVEAPASEVLDVLMDFEAYPEWAKQVRSARVLSTDAEGRPEKVEFEVAPGPLPKLRYVLRYTYPGDGLAWDYVEGDVKDIRGAYVLDDMDGWTNVTYQLAVDPGRIPLPGFIKARAAREISKVALHELKRRVEG